MGGSFVDHATISRSCSAGLEATTTNSPQNIQVESPELGASGSHLTWEHSLLGSNRFPRLKWSPAADAAIPGTAIQEYILICEDPDSPLPKMSPAATKDELVEEIEGKIVGWGVWIENKW
ncbi:hypothetical protein A1O3_08817 [Capronia epimyces CBS 606.96]|uniref:Uncharacterized protein n=1 Tax=Capronia epimyces CBS 606.96 TaxID=1182542 RepID=W9XPQ8_9EURO|nr:uncharacterized protein A1O3_08817 [Capronia epimyces CBS 606.96]EXJ79315.1 hypothetical protein A1O3_08817 [Capronia epimyces CBS 606.96]